MLRLTGARGPLGRGCPAAGRPPPRRATTCRALSLAPLSLAPVNRRPAHHSPGARPGRDHLTIRRRRPGPTAADRRNTGQPTPDLRLLDPGPLLHRHLRAHPVNQRTANLRSSHPHPTQRRGLDAGPLPTELHVTEPNVTELCVAELADT
ncbi:hypothetical protein [Kitasatospora sp. MMS16-BH015]|uniref:hypothetical protein n=1 Tax=Kitasatospora sp. MMS16-BH015 TaxID=2018025 RepID=UPI0020C302D2|nr:hypothetical protein [Kitasatospora sp. MMS16-BH015]